MFDSLKAMSQLGPMMAKAREMQAKMAELQQRLGALQATGTAGGGLVTATANGRLELLDIVFAADAPIMDRAAMAELTLSAVNLAMANARQIVQAEMRKITGDVDLSAVQQMLGGA